MALPKVTFEHAPEDCWLPPRREFMKRLMGGVAATAVLPATGLAGTSAAAGPKAEAAPTPVPGQRDDEQFWNLVKDQFPLRDDLIVMNAANLCPSPYQVQRAVFGLTRDIDSDPSHTNRGKFGGLRREARAALAAYVGADPEEIVLVRNTSEGNNVVISGLTLGAGDEVVIWDQNHPTCNLAWDVGAKRHGYSVRKVSTPPAPRNRGDLMDPFLDALTGNTRVLAFSHVSNISGVALPAGELCRQAAERGILTLVDGAQTYGAEALDLHAMGCDFFTGSAHKWPMGPKEAGLLYVSRERIDEVWPLMVGIGWSESPEDAAPRFEALGQRDDARVAAVGEMVAFHDMIGRERVEERVRALASELKRRIGEELPGTRFHTPIEPDLSLGVVVFTPPGVDLNRAMSVLYEEHGIGCAVMRGDFAGIRLSPHIYNTMEEVERAVEAVASLAQ